VAGMPRGYSSIASDVTTADRRVRELCHDLMEPAATIRLLAQVADAEAADAEAAEAEAGDPASADAAPALQARLRSRLRVIDAAATQIAAICERVLEQGGALD
jgi:hypothetical protein